jgi:long-chain acyl-CoA synthetase
MELVRPGEVSFPAILRAHADVRGDVVAIEADGRSLDYRTLDRRSDLFASALHSSGIAAGDRVAILAKSCVEYFEFLIGSMKAGVVPVPVNWRLAPPEIAAVLNDAEPVLLVVGEEFIERVEGIECRLEHVRRIVSLAQHKRFLKWATWIDDHADLQYPVEIRAETVVLQIYTSGTTGAPKGVMTSSAGFLSYLQSLSSIARFTSQSVSLSTMPLFHIGGIGWTFAGLYGGATVLLLRDVDPDLILSMVASRKVTNLIAVPSVVQMLLQSPVLSSTEFDSLRYLYYGGGPVTEHILRRALDAFACEFIQGFGMTECPLISALGPEDHAPGRDLLRSCGRPIPGTTVRLVDPATGRDALPGSVGEIWVQSPQLCTGYWKKPELTKETLVDGVWLRTGDAAHCNSEGFLFLHDRLKDMIVSGGENVYPAEVENVLITHPGVAECAVIGVPSEKWIETVKAIVVPVPGSIPAPDLLIAYCKTRLAGYKCPTSVDYVDSLPRTPSGKVIKQQLRDRHSQEAPGSGDQNPTSWKRGTRGIDP